MTEYAAAWEPVDVKEIGPLIISYRLGLRNYLKI